MRRLLTLMLLLLSGSAWAELRVVSVERIWDAAPHNAFTDLVRWRERWYCAFREGDGHVGGDGRARVLASTDGKGWESAALMEEAGVDLRDPKLSVTPDNRLMAVMGGSIYREGELVGMRPRVSFSTDGTRWSAPEPVLEEGHWLWRVTWHKGMAYGVSYGGAAGENGGPGARLVKSVDGLAWETVPGFGADEHCNEATLRFAEDDTCHAIIRRDGGDRQGWLGQSRPPYTDWTWTPCGHALGGPDFVMTPKGWFAGSRDVRQAATTVVARMTANSYEPLLTLPSGGDTSYPGMVWHENEIWMSYYASHEGKSAIYLARIAVE